MVGFLSIGRVDALVSCGRYLGANRLPLFGIRNIWVDLIGSEFLAREWGNDRRNRLCGPCYLQGMSDLGTGRSTMGQIGFPVARSST